MAITRLTCPDCGKVLRPARPVAEGKKVKCPECDLIFVAGEEEEDVRPRKASSETARKPAPGKSTKKSAPAVKAKEKPKDEDEEVYGYIKDPDEDDEEKKVKINYAPDMSVKDPRGPAIVTLTGPSTKLQLVGMAGVLGWLGLFVLLLIPTVFPITPDEKEREEMKRKEEQAKRAGIDPNEKGKEGAKGPGFFSVYGFDLAPYFLILMVPMILLFVYSSLVVGGGIKMQNLESRAWGITASILAMIPIHILGFQMVTFMVIQFGVGMIIDDQDYIMFLASGLAGIEYLICLVIGGWSLATLMKEDVIEGFEFVPE